MNWQKKKLPTLYTIQQVNDDRQEETKNLGNEKFVATDINHLHIQSMFKSINHKIDS